MVAALFDLSAYNPPQGDHLMALLKAYLDDSGDPNDPQHSVVTVAGYVSTVDGWKWFEGRWPSVMKKHKVPYLHMKELWNREGVFKEMKATEGAEIDFLRDCIMAIQTATEFAISATIRLADLRAFNEERGLSLDPVALALYGCLIELRHRYADDEIEIFLDRIKKPYLTIDRALEYARSDTYADLKVDSLIVAPLAAAESFRNILPIQAADFTAWEIRKNCEERKTFTPSEASRYDNAAFRLELEGWRIERLRASGKLPHDNRRSATILSAWPPPSGYIWDAHNIKAAHVNRHKNGWGC